MTRFPKILLSLAMYFERTVCPNTVKNKSTEKKKIFSTKK